MKYMANQIVSLTNTRGSPLEINSDFNESTDVGLYSKIIEKLRTISDPEISLNIYDLGLIYRLTVSEYGNVAVDMTLTSAACPVAGSLPNQVAKTIKSIKGVGEVQVNLVWDPPWNQDRMSDEAKLILGLL